MGILWCIIYFHSVKEFKHNHNGIPTWSISIADRLKRLVVICTFEHDLSKFLGLRIFAEDLCSFCIITVMLEMDGQKFFEDNYSAKYASLHWNMVSNHLVIHQKEVKILRRRLILRQVVLVAVTRLTVVLFDPWSIAKVLIETIWGTYLALSIEIKEVYRAAMNHLHMLLERFCIRKSDHRITLDAWFLEGKEFALALKELLL